jgi:hypothetical protein
MPQSGEIASATSKSRTTIAIAGLYLITFFAIFLAAGLQIQGMFQTRQERIESQVWPAVTAVVDGCALDHYSASSRRSVTYKIRCRLTYSINGTDYQSRTQTVGQRHSSFGNPQDLPPDAQQMETWVNQHKKGSPMLIHYDPANPANISLAGADNAFRTNTAAISLAAARQVAFLAALLFLASLLARTFNRPRESD